MHKMLIALNRFVCFSVLAFTSVLCLAQKPELVVQTGHSNDITAVAFSPDAKMLATASEDHTVGLWDVGSGRELRILKGHSGDVFSVAFSPAGQLLASSSMDQTIKLWNVSTGQLLLTLTGHSNSVFRVAFSFDGKTLISSSWNEIKFWDVATGVMRRTFTHPEGLFSPASTSDLETFAAVGRSNRKIINVWHIGSAKPPRTLTGHSDDVGRLSFSPDGDTLASTSEDKTIKLWKAVTGAEVRTLKGHAKRVSAVVFNPQGTVLASSAADRTVKLWSVETGQELRTIVQSSMGESLAFSPDGQWLAVGGEDGTIGLWEVATGLALRKFTGHTRWVYSVAMSANGQNIAAASPDGTVKLWDAGSARGMRVLVRGPVPRVSVAFSPDGLTLASGTAHNTLELWDVASGRMRSLAGHTEGQNWVRSLAFSRDGLTLASAGSRFTIQLWNTSTGVLQKEITANDNLIHSVAFSPDGSILASGNFNNTIQLFKTNNGSQLRVLTGHTNSVNSVAFNNDGTLLASGSTDGTVRIWDVVSGQQRRLLQPRDKIVGCVTFSPDGRVLAAARWDGTIELFYVTNGQHLRTLKDHSHIVESITFSSDGKFLVSGSWDTTLKLWNVQSGEMLATLIALDETDWAVIAPDGRFDASPGAQKLMHWRVGNEPVELEQLKEEFYEPHLLAKLMGFNREPMRNVSAFTDVKLFPVVEWSPPQRGETKLNIKLTNRGGGIGPVQVLVNGQEMVADARPANFNPNETQATLTVDLKDAPVIGGEANKIRVIAWNFDPVTNRGYIASRGDSVSWTPAVAPTSDKPELYAIVAGVSEYSSQLMNLKYPANDAQAVATALKLGGNRLFGTEKVHLKLLTAPSADPNALATKENFREAFAEFRKAKPTDVFVIYLAGHGISLRTGNDLYLYLTQEARTTDSSAVSNPNVRAQVAITSEELLEWIKQVPALKRVLILDTCAAGAASANLVSRDLPSDTIRAIERLKDRTGFHVLLGSAADAPSYEASHYGHGLLTYTFLQALRGAALKPNGEVDVQTVFQYAADQVPLLAKDIGGIQRPEVRVPNGGESFSIGLISNEDRSRVPLASRKPTLLPPRLQNLERGFDDLRLEQALAEVLRDRSYGPIGPNEAPAFNYVESVLMPDAIQPSGFYRVNGGDIEVTIKLIRDQTEVGSLVVTGNKTDVKRFCEKIVDAIVGFLKGQPNNQEQR